MKIPLSYSLKNRNSTTAKDARVLNGYVEVVRNRRDPRKVDSVRTIKRPAIDSAFELTAGEGQGLFVINTPDGDDVLGTVIDDILTRAPTAKTKRLSFGVQPTESTLNTAISPSVTVTIRDSLGNVVNSTANVVIALASNPTGATLGGTLTRAAVAGTATFNDLTLNRSGEDFTLRATSSGLNSAVSGTFDIPTTCVFTVQPSGAKPGVTLDPVEVTIQDTAGNTDTAYNGNITLSIYSATAAGTLSGTLTVQATAGVASFANLQIDVEGTYTLLAVAEPVSTAYPPARAVSDFFVISSIEYQLTISANTSAYNVQLQFLLTFGIVNSPDLLVTIAPGVVVSSSGTGTAALTWGSGAWVGTPTFTLVNNGYIVGVGGDGGEPGVFTSPDASDGGDGENAIELSGNTVTINNASGFIWGGGGGGGGPGSYLFSGLGRANMPGGPGGGGAPFNGAGGAALAANEDGVPQAQGATSAPVATFVWTYNPVALPSSGGNSYATLNDPPNTQSAGAAGAQIGTVALDHSSGSLPLVSMSANSGVAGNAGDWGANGSNGGAVPSITFTIGNQADLDIWVVTTTGSPGSGGSAGKAINLSSGTANFTGGSGAPNVKGAVS